jgi:hypothetical protein
MRDILDTISGYYTTKDFTVTDGGVLLHGLNTVVLLQNKEVITLRVNKDSIELLRLEDGIPQVEILLPIDLWVESDIVHIDTITMFEL